MDVHILILGPINCVDKLLMCFSGVFSGLEYMSFQIRMKRYNEEYVLLDYAEM